MINRLVWMETDNAYPYRNLVMEGYVTFHVPQGICTLYLWQNCHTVVTGKNQNCWRECRANFLEQENGYLVRRFPGGGVVLHDPGNLNSIFIVGTGDYDVSWQLDVTLEAVRSPGIHAEKTGRSDITVDGCKFLGNVLYRTGDGCYHHGAILTRTDKENTSRYLNVSKKKLASKRVTPVRSRVANLYESKPDITLEEVKPALVEVFPKVYGQPAVRTEEGELSQPGIDARTEKFVSWQWKYGRKIPFEYEMEKRFPWDNTQTQFRVGEGMTQGVGVFSDVMDQEMIEMLAEQFKGYAYAKEDICRVVKAMGTDAFQAEECMGADEPQSYRIKEDIMIPVREPL